MAGTGWSCSANSCSRSDVLIAGSSYLPITVTVDVALAGTLLPPAGVVVKRLHEERPTVEDAFVAMVHADQGRARVAKGAAA